MLVCTVIAAASTIMVAAAETQERTSGAAKATPELQLTKGMPADAVIKIMGKSHETAPMEVPVGKAEVWVYRRPFAHMVSQVQVGAKPITILEQGADGVNRTRVIAEEPIYRTMHQITEEEVSLLMFNEHFVEKKTVRTERREFD